MFRILKLAVIAKKALGNELEKQKAETKEKVNTMSKEKEITEKKKLWPEN